MTRDEARRTLMRQADALARRGYDDAPLVSEAIDVLCAPVNQDDIMTAVNAGTDLATEAIGRAGFGCLNPDGAYNIACLVVNAIGTVLDEPTATMVDVLVGNFDASTIGDWRQELGDEIVDAALALLKEGASG
jgi:hypothetical protein